MLISWRKLESNNVVLMEHVWLFRFHWPTNVLAVMPTSAKQAAKAVLLAFFIFAQIKEARSTQAIMTATNTSRVGQKAKPGVLA